MVESHGRTVKNCPIGFNVCYPSCFFWAKAGCKYPTFAQTKQLEDLKAMRAMEIERKR